MNDNTAIDPAKRFERRYRDTIVACIGMAHRDVQARLVWMLSTDWLDEMSSVACLGAFDLMEPIVKARYYATVDLLEHYRVKIQKDEVDEAAAIEEVEEVEEDEEEPPLTPSLLRWNFSKLAALKLGFELAQADGNTHFSIDFADGEPPREYTTKFAEHYISFIEESLTWMGAPR